MRFHTLIFYHRSSLFEHHFIIIEMREGVVYYRLDLIYAS